MSDPTELVLTFALATAVVVFLAAAVWKKAAAGRQAGPPPLPPPLPVDFPSSPYVPPAAHPVAESARPAWGVSSTLYRPLDLLGAAFVFAVFGVLVVASLRAGDAGTAALNAETLVINIGFQFFMAGVVTMVVLPRCGLVAWLGLRWRSWPLVFLLAPGAVLLMWLITGGLHLAGYVKWMESLGVDTTQDAVRLLRETQDPRVLGLMAFAAVVAAPLCEEVVFRGYLYPVLKKFSGPAVATFSSALIFAAAHGNLTALLPLLLFGGLLVLLYEKSGSLWAPVAAHFCFNAVTVAAQMAIRHYEMPIGLIP